MIVLRKKVVQVLLNVVVREWLGKYNTVGSLPYYHIFKVYSLFFRIREILTPSVILVLILHWVKAPLTSSSTCFHHYQVHEITQSYILFFCSKILGIYVLARSSEWPHKLGRQYNFHMPLWSRSSLPGLCLIYCASDSKEWHWEFQVRNNVQCVIPKAVLCRESITLETMRGFFS